MSPSLPASPISSRATTSSQEEELGGSSFPEQAGGSVGYLDTGEPKSAKSVNVAFKSVMRPGGQVMEVVMTRQWHRPLLVADVQAQGAASRSEPHAGQRQRSVDRVFCLSPTAADRLG